MGFTLEQKKLPKRVIGSFTIPDSVKGAYVLWEVPITSHTNSFSKIVTYLVILPQ